MKNYIRSMALAGSCCLGLFGWCSLGQAQGFYFSADAGVSLAEKVDVKRFVGPASGELKFDPGVRFSLSGGYNFNEYIGVGLETGYIFNNEKNNNQHSGDISLSHVPMMANVVVRYDKPDLKWVPFGGVGAGGDVSILTVDKVRVGGGSEDDGEGEGDGEGSGTTTGVVDGTGSTVVFAWQAFAGVRYKLTEKVSIGAVYKYYSASASTYDVTGSNGDIKLGRASVHSFGVDFTIKF